MFVSKFASYNFRGALVGLQHSERRSRFRVVRNFDAAAEHPDLQRPSVGHFAADKKIFITLKNFQSLKNFNPQKFVNPEKVFNPKKFLNPQNFLKFGKFSTLKNFQSLNFLITKNFSPRKFLHPQNF